MELERRQEPRIKTEFDMRIYSSIKKGAYSVKITDLSKGGAFIRSKHLPNLGETISYELFDDTFKSIHFGSARVSRILSDVSTSEQGFSVVFFEKLTSQIANQLNIALV